MLHFTGVCLRATVAIAVLLPAAAAHAQSADPRAALVGAVSAAVPSLPLYGASDANKRPPLCTTAQLTQQCSNPLKFSYTVQDDAAKGAVPGPDGKRSYGVNYVIDPAYSPRSADEVAQTWQAKAKTSPCGRTPQGGPGGGASCKGNDAGPGAIDINFSGDPYTASGTIFAVRPCADVWAQVTMYLSTVPSHGARNKPDVIAGMKQAASGKIDEVAQTLLTAVDKGCAAAPAGGTTGAGTTAQATPTSTPAPEDKFQITAFLDCGNVVQVRVGTTSNPGQGTLCNLVIDGFKTNTSDPIVVTATNAAGAPANFSFGGLVPNTGVVVSPGDFTQDPTNLSKPWYADLIFYACPQTNSCGDARAGEPVITPTDPTAIRLHVTQQGAGEAWVDLTMKPVGGGSSTRVQGCALGRSVTLNYVARDPSSDLVLFDALFQSNITTAISFLRLEVTDAFGNPYPFGGTSTRWESVPDPLNPGTSDPRTELNLLHVVDPNTGQELTNPVGQVGFVGPVAIPGGTPTDYNLIVRDPDHVLTGDQTVVLTAYIEDPFTLSCQMTTTTVIPLSARSIVTW